MQKTALISLVGEQPIPNLLPILYFKPEQNLFVHTKQTKEIARRLQEKFKGDLEETDAYNMKDIERTLEDSISLLIKENYQVWCNLTGGTKPMALAVSRIAMRYSLPFFYLQSEGSRNIIYKYWVNAGELELEREEIPTLLNLDLYLYAHQGLYEEKETSENPFEKQIYEVLRENVDEIKREVRFKAHPAVEIDLVLRRGNFVGIAEIKSGKKAKEKRALEQLITAGENRFLGTFTNKFLILDREYEENNRKLAQAFKVEVVELPSAQEGPLSDADRQKLIEAIRRKLSN
ncbi:DUF1887 family CARF protein [Hydrogenibacillus sp. N12]|uniref:Card1-like endonuclease domain-containing protein n=1 Tax=Hydrogenibacillus sp. N12 TaxID=2866627 RepID=UPI001C7DBFE6|nr:DUF1887 family CARF protein [Hydrogenibacillus sp. N12]QZA33211.1 DUF1887 family protein [Hydrogenibacillus sp. N12]